MASVVRADEPYGTPPRMCTYACHVAHSGGHGDSSTVEILPSLETVDLEDAMSEPPSVCCEDGMESRESMEVDAFVLHSLGISRSALRCLLSLLVSVCLRPCARPPTYPHQPTHPPPSHPAHMVSVVLHQFTFVAMWRQHERAGATQARLGLRRVGGQG